MIDKNKDKVQQEALRLWVDNDKEGTLQIITGLGKTFISLHALYTMKKDDRIHLFLAEQVDRVKDLKDDIEKYNKLFKRDVLNDYNLQFYCYQTVYKWKNKHFGLVIADEIHDSITPAYSKFYFNNTYDAIIGLSATIPLETKYIINDRVVTKGMFLNKIAPICFTYSIDDGQKDNTSRKLEVYIIENELDSIKKTVKAGSKKKPFYQSEQAAYDYWNTQHKRAWFEEDYDKQQLRIRITAQKRSSILYNLESKVEIVKKLLHVLDTKTIIFGNSIPSLLKITPNVITSKNSAVKNDRLRDAFDNDKIQVIGSFKKLKQGANLKDLDNCIIMSYYSTDKDFIQRIGRLRNNNTVGRVFIIRTKDTQEEIWFNKIFENLNNLDLIFCDSVESCIKTMENNGSKK